ncbi:MAG: YfhO family protein, partial [Planctomycetota bacterium]
AVALVAFAAIDLFAQARLYNPFVPRAWIAPRTEVTDWLRAQPGVFRISGVSPPLEVDHPRLDWYDRRYKGDSIPPNLAMPYRLCDIRGRSSLFPFWVRDYCQAITGNDDIRVLIDYRAPEHRDRRVHWLSPRYVLSPEPLDGEAFRLVLDQPLAVYEDRRALPRAFLGQASSGRDGATLLPAGPPGARIETYAPNEVRLRVTDPAGRRLVLTDTWYPGWRAFVDGEERPIARVNRMVRAVEVRAGERRVHMVYEPQSFRLGLFLSLIGVAVVFAVLGARLAGGPGRPDSRQHREQEPRRGGTRTEHGQGVSS